VLHIDRLLWSSVNTKQLLASHNVTIDDVEDVLFGVDREEPDYRHLRDGSTYVVYGETGDGRLLVIALERISPGFFRPFAARDMGPKERRAYRNRKRTR
jgi:uncharacterized DUF497 family protein